MTWNPQTYLAFADQRTRPAAELLARIPIERPARVIDLGCGPGNSTALLAARWPGARLEGLDSSAAMLEDARASGVPATWILDDIAAWAPQAPYDVIFSNATFQWLPDQDASAAPVDVLREDRRRLRVPGAGEFRRARAMP